MIQDSVVALIPEDRIGEVLPVIHRSGYGHVVRLVRAGKRPVLDQLQRAGVPIAQAPELIGGLPAVLVISAAARSPMASALVMRHGASRIWIVTAQGAWNEVEDSVLAQPNVHVMPPHPARQSPRVDGRAPETAAADQFE